MTSATPSGTLAVIIANRTRRTRRYRLVVGFLAALVIAVFALILVPFTIAGSAKDQWKDGGIIAMLVIGFCCIPVLLFWELKAKHPLIPFRVSGQG